jgi:hypothetical protein
MTLVVVFLIWSSKEMEACYSTIFVETDMEFVTHTLVPIGYPACSVPKFCLLACLVYVENMAHYLGID